MNRLMTIAQCKTMIEVPAAISKWENAHADFVSRSGTSGVPEEWKLPLLFRMIPASDLERIKMHFKYMPVQDKTYLNFSRTLIEMAGERAYDNMLKKHGSDDMDCSSLPAGQYTDEEWEEYRAE